MNMIKVCKITTNLVVKFPFIHTRLHTKIYIKLHSISHSNKKKFLQSSKNTAEQAQREREKKKWLLSR